MYYKYSLSEKISFLEWHQWMAMISRMAVSDICMSSLPFQIFLLLSLTGHRHASDCCIAVRTRKPSIFIYLKQDHYERSAKKKHILTSQNANQCSEILEEMRLWPWKLLIIGLLYLLLKNWLCLLFLSLTFLAVAVYLCLIIYQHAFKKYQ